MLESDSLRRTALLLVLIGLLWNVVEGGVALWAGARSGSVAILAFGLDSIIELLAGGVLIWRLWGGRSEMDAESAEAKSQQLLGLSFFLLAAYVVLHSGASLLGWLPEPRPSLAGAAIVAASAVVMAGLYVGKMRIAERMQSRSLRAEAMESLFCDLQDLTILVGLVLNGLLAWWWADPVAALFLVPLFVREGMENLSGHEEEDEGGAAKVCFCGGCFFGVRACGSACHAAQS
ncbi:MAG: cation transporter [Chloroflexota bacterium]|nr:cation transporter [Chloroflexota bacterium]MDE2942259.1 cation transporter [Chloroflexota bacterium]MDE3267747.1 cation transporter [Chloroflexota bacterium]